MAINLNLKIGKKDLWLLAAIMVFLVGVGYVIAYGSGASPSVMGHSSEEIEQVEFGSWTDKDSDGNTLVKDSIYQATSDGYVTAYQSAGGDGYVIGYTDSDPNPTTVRARDGYNDYSVDNGMPTMPVRKNDYWKITTEPATTLKIQWLPIGNGECIKQ